MTVEELRDRVTLTVPEAGQLLGYRSRSSAYEAAAKGYIPGVKQVGGKKIVSAPVLLAWLLDEDEPTKEGDVVLLRRTG